MNGEQKKKEYERPAYLICLIDDKDVVTASGGAQVKEVGDEWKFQISDDNIWG